MADIDDLLKRAEEPDEEPEEDSESTVKGHVSFDGTDFSSLMVDMPSAHG